MATLLSITQDACDLIGIDRPSAVIASTDQQIRTLLAMSNREGREIVREYDWSVLTRLATVTTTADTGEYALTDFITDDDFDRLIPESEWDTSNQRPMFGPASSEEWRWLKSSGLGSGVIWYRYRIFRSSSGIGRSIYFDPAPSASSDSLTFEYISSHWCVDTTETTTASAWAVDTDVPIVNSDLLTLGTVIRFKRSKGFDFASEADEYEQLLSQLKGQDKPAPVVNLAAQTRVRLLGPENVPDQGYGS